MAGTSNQNIIAMSVGGSNQASPNSVITIFRRVHLAQLMGGSQLVSPLPITHVAFGNGGVDGDRIPTQPSEAQIALNNELGRYPTTVTFPGSPQTIARHSVTIPVNDLGGEQINEAALVDSVGNIHAILNFYDKAKDFGSIMEFIFEDKFYGGIPCG